MGENIKSIIAANPSGLLELKPAMSIPAYRENFGFKLKNVFTIYESKRMRFDRKEWFAFPNQSLPTLVSVQEESSGDLLVVYIVETIKNDEIRCHLVLSNEAYQGILRDATCHVLQVHQMYTKFFRDHIALNMAD
jgi:hypothetical protein